jgi:HEAT repeat protein
MDDDIASLLSDLHDSRKDVRAEAARMLGKAGAPALPGLLQAVCDPDWVVRYRALEALAEIRDPRVDPVLIASLHDDRDHVRYMAAKALGARRIHQALTPLLSGLRDENEFVRLSITRSLAALGDRGAVPALREALQRETAERVKAEIQNALGRFGQSQDP